MTSKKNQPQSVLKFCKTGNFFRRFGQGLKYTQSFAEFTVNLLYDGLRRLVVTSPSAQQGLNILLLCLTS